MGKISNLTDIFQMGWNHQLDEVRGLQRDVVFFMDVSGMCSFKLQFEMCMTSDMQLFSTNKHPSKWEFDLPSLKLTVRTWKWMVGIPVSFRDGQFSGAMLVSGSVPLPVHIVPWKSAVQLPTLTSTLRQQTARMWGLPFEASPKLVPHVPFAKHVSGGGLKKNKKKRGDAVDGNQKIRGENQLRER